MDILNILFKVFSGAHGYYLVLIEDSLVTFLYKEN